MVTWLIRDKAGIFAQAYLTLVLSRLLTEDPLPGVQLPSWMGDLAGIEELAHFSA